LGGGSFSDHWLPTTDHCFQQRGLARPGLRTGEE
jgi:hypothetical protein